METCKREGVDMNCNNCGRFIPKRKMSFASPYLCDACNDAHKIKVVRFESNDVDNHYAFLDVDLIKK